MGIREVTRSRWDGRLSRGMSALNARHPWSHNDHFHPWLLARLPDQRGTALDVGCGRGELLAQLAARFDRAHGTDADASMRAAAASRCAGLPNVTVDGAALPDLHGPVDVVTMVAVLHHLDVAEALRDVERLLAPGGVFLCVGLAPPASALDHAWDVASIVTNPVIGFVKHPWVSRDGVQPPPVPIADPRLTYDEVRALVEPVMPGARMRHHLAFRHTIEWTKPAATA